MREQNRSSNKNFIKKIFIKICRLLGYEIIDQNNFYVPTQNKNLNENLNVYNKKSINLPLGETKISRKVVALTIIFRSCTSINMLTQNKKRLFEKEKSEYTFRSLNSLISSSEFAIKNFPNIKINFVIIDHNSKDEDLKQIKKQLENSAFENEIINLDIREFENKIKKVNQKKENVSLNQISNMCNIYKSLTYAKNKCSDLIYFVEDDYLHEKDAISEMIYSYERISSQIKKELILCPADYPYLYTKADNTNIFLGSKKHWRKISESLCTFLTSKIIIDKYWQELISMCEYEHYPFETPLHKIYELENCFSPIPSSAIHFTNINSIFGLSPNVDWKRIWDENENY